MFFNRRVAHQQHSFPRAGGHVYHPRQALIPFLPNELWQAYLVRCGGDRNILQIATICMSVYMGAERAILDEYQRGRVCTLSIGVFCERQNMCWHSSLRRARWPTYCASHQDKYKHDTTLQKMLRLVVHWTILRVYI